MTDKQKAILEAALKLFANKGFDAVATSAIAKEAGVSEGLIFRHFENKAGLLDAIMQMGKEKVAEELEKLYEIKDAGQRLMALMELPFHIDEQDYPFWRLIYSLKWQNQEYDKDMSHPMRDLLIAALSELKYVDVQEEADLIESYIDGFATTILLKGASVNKDKLLQILRKKYN